DLRSFPVIAGGKPLPNAIYSAHVAGGGPSAVGATAFDAYFGFPRLRAEHPVFVGEWGGSDDDLDWGSTLGACMRERHRYRTGAWQGLAGWTAWSWGDTTDLVARIERTQGALTWRPYQVDAAGRHVATPFGALVERELHTQPYAGQAVGPLDPY